MPYDNLVTDFPASDLLPGDTFVSPDWQYGYVVVDVSGMGFTPDPDKVYVQSLVESMGSTILKTQTVKKVKMYHYTFQD